MASQSSRGRVSSEDAAGWDAFTVAFFLFLWFNFFIDMIDIQPMFQVCNMIPCLPMLWNGHHSKSGFHLLPHITICFL